MLDMDTKIKKSDYDRLASELSKAKQRIAELEVSCVEPKQATVKSGLSHVLTEDIFDNITDILWLKDKAGKYIIANKAFCKTCGVRYKDLIGKTDLDIWPKDLAKKYMADDKEVISKNKKIVVEETLVDNKGRVISIETTKIPLKGRQGRPTGTLGMAHDITNRKETKEQVDLLNQFLDSIVENIPNMIFLKDAKDLRFIRFNKAGEILLGRKKDELIGKNDYDFFPKQQADFFISKDRDVLNHKEILDIPEERIKTKYKGERILHTKKVPILDEQSRPKYLLGISEDITDRKTTEEQLLAIKQQMEFVLGATRTGLDIIDSDYNLIYIDPAWGRYYGDPAGKKCYEYFMCQKTACPNCGVTKALKLKQPVVTEEILKKENNRPIEVTSIPFKDKNGKWLVAEVNLDITERKKAYVEIQELVKVQKALKDSERQYRALFESANDAIFLADCQTGIIMDANKKAGQMLGRTVKDIIGTHYCDLHPKKDRPIYENIFNSFANTKRQLFNSLVVVHKTGRHIPVQISSSIIRLRGRSCLVGIFSDITELKRIEDRLKKDKGSLESIVAEKRKDLGIALKDLEDARRLADIGTLSAMVAHELRNPLGVIKTAAYNLAQALKKQPVIGVKNHIDNIDKKIYESDRIINNLLAYSKVMRPSFEKINIRSVVEDCVGDFNTKYSDLNVRLRLECDLKGSGEIKADRIQIVSLLLNLLDNAYQSYDRPGRIELRCEDSESKKKISIIIKDNGSGISKKDLQKVFEPFFTSKAKGIGLGLTTCKQIVTTHGGSIDIKSIEGKGTSVKITLPTYN
jgi:PAS domain S-box-containing protein